MVRAFGCRLRRLGLQEATVALPSVGEAQGSLSFALAQAGVHHRGPV